MGATASEVKGVGITLLSRSVSLVREIGSTLDGMSSEIRKLKLTVLDFSEKLLFDSAAYLVIVDLETWKSNDESVLEELRKLGYKGPVIVLTTLNKEDKKPSTENKLTFFNRSKGPAELQDLIRRLLKDVMLHDRKHVRHTTDQIAQILIPGRTDFLTVRVRNLSEGGAYLEADAPLLLIKGDPVSVRIRLPKLERIHVLKARVAWVRKNAVGVQFVDHKVT